MKPTIKDVAKLAGVSFKTVSRVINREPRVGQDLQDKVWKAIKELNYQPNLSARGLRGAASSIGFIYDNPNSNYVIDMQRGILEECHRQGYELVIHPCDTKAPDLLNELFRMLDRSQVGGLVVTPPASEMPQVLEALSQRGVATVPIISGSEPPAGHSPCVYIDDRSAAHQITEYLIELGHRRIAFLCGDEAHKSSTERLEGYLEALREHQIEPTPELILQGQYSFESGVERSKQLLALNERPSAVFACNDEIAAGTLFATRLAGIEVPKDLSIVGFEDSPFSRQAWPNLTTAQQPIAEIGRRATALLINRLRAEKSPSTLDSEGFHPKLILRDSTTPPTP
ncbi:LacI family DNA-binding transcriptional regulator [Marinimicrobium sp. ABcell2]|uniref:LacI family DNA-binding transcriptional regulator n=1 Tax=Marinimicrobium sp. ABcell2 TaxID=3069751 RepID=UPI0027B49F5B|nr:LacI family DNA-binding transcriptional regulator [Marinimicrobium sp. ABcell2]MDQ2075919.1 LacI family DNA-binding transcriptional regulator [Marinimicrobium sp. ABcell2]